MAKQSKSTNTGNDSAFVHGELRTGPIAGTAIISGQTFNNKSVLYANVDGLAIFEGDIVLGKISDLQAFNADSEGIAMQSVGITGQQFRWTNATIPYQIDGSMPNQQRVTDAIAHWEANTSIRFVLRTAANAITFPDFVNFQSGGGCSSMVGRQGGQQNITLGNGCSTGNAIHEIGHTVGLWHEQSREDRDSFVQILWANIDAPMQHNFVQHISDGDDLGAYDYGSIMHYPVSAFSNNGLNTIVPLQPVPTGVTIGQRSSLSPGDIAGVRAMYPSLLPTIKEVRKDPIRETVKEISKDPIRDTIKEISKDPIRDTIKEISKDPIRDTIKEISKDPIRDTIKEISRDPIGTLIETTRPGPFRGFDPTASVSPFILATPSRVSNTAVTTNTLDDLNIQAQVLADEIAQIEQYYTDLLANYDFVIQNINDIQSNQF